MDSHEAKLILNNYTLGQDAHEDPRFQEALALVDTDSELAAWWERQREEDALIRDQLTSFEPPADLRAALQQTLSHQTTQRKKIVAFRNWLSMAAALALVASLYFVYGVDRSDDYTGPLAERAYNYSVDGPRLKYFDKDTQNLRTWLTSNGFELPKQLPPKLLELEGIGCRPLDWSQERVALMCFNSDTVYHLFIGNEKDFPSFEASEEIGYNQFANGWTMSKWKDNEHLFVLTAKTTVDQMSDYLASYTPGTE